MGFFSLEAKTARQQNEARKRQQELAERQQRMAEQRQRYEQNPFNTLLQSFARAAPQAAAQALGNIAVDQVRYQYGGGKRALQETERANLAKELQAQKALSEQSRASKELEKYRFGSLDETIRSNQANEALTARLRDIQERQQGMAEYKLMPGARPALSQKYGWSPTTGIQQLGSGGQPSMVQPLSMPFAEQDPTVAATPAPPTVISMEDGNIMATKEVYEDALELAKKESPALVTNLMEARPEGSQQTVSLNGTEYMPLSRGQSRLVARYMDQKKEEVRQPPRIDAGRSPFAGLGASTTRFPSQDYGAYQYATSDERKAIRTAQDKQYERFSKNLQKKSDLFLKYAAAPGDSKGKYDSFLKGLANEINELPPNQRRKALADVQSMITLLPDEKQEAAFEKFVTVSKGTIGSVTGKFKPRPLVKITPGTKVSGAMKGHTANILKYDKELKAVNKELETATGEEKAELQERRNFLKGEIYFHQQKFDELSKRPNIEEFGGLKNYETEGGIRTLSDIETGETKALLGKEAERSESISSLANNIRTNPRMRSQYERAIQESNFSEKNEVLAELDTLTGKARAQRIAEVVVDNDIPLGGTKRGGAPTAPSKDRALLESARSEFRETVQSIDPNINEMSSDSDVAKVIGVTPAQYSKYMENSTTGSPRADRKIASYIKSNIAAFDVEALESQDVTPPGYEAALKKNPWLASEGVEYFRGLDKTAQQYLMSKFENPTIFKNRFKINPTLY